MNWTWKLKSYQTPVINWWKEKKYHAFGTIPKIHEESLKRAKLVMITHLYTTQFLDLVKTLMQKSGVVQPVLWTHTPVLAKWCGHTSVFRMWLSEMQKPSHIITGEQRYCKESWNFYIIYLIFVA